jgi:hypothetical protein
MAVGGAPSLFMRMTPRLFIDLSSSASAAAFRKRRAHP